MSNQIDKNKEKGSKYIASTGTWFKFSGRLVIGLWIFFIFSVCFKLFKNTGIFTFLFSLDGIILHHWTFFNPSALLEVSKTIGVLSVFIAWIYAELGKYELGKPYTTLLSKFCKWYNWRALSYIFAILSCIYISTLEILESAGLAMLIAIIGLFDQAVVLVVFIFNSDIRKKLAIEQWESDFDGRSTKPNILPYIFTLIDNISLNEDAFDDLCSVYCRGVIAYTRKNNEHIDISSETIREVSYIWDRLLSHVSEHEHHALLNGIFNKLNTIFDEDSCRNEKIFIICAGFIFHQSGAYKKEAFSPTEKEVFINMLSDISDIGIIYNSGTECSVTFLLEILLKALCWMHFLCNNINLDKELLNFLAECSPLTCTSYDTYIKEFLLCTFDNADCEKHYKLVLTQVKS